MDENVKEVLKKTTALILRQVGFEVAGAKELDLLSLVLSRCKVVFHLHAFNF